MPSVRSLFVTFAAAVACATGVVASPSSHYSPVKPLDGLVPRGAIFDPRCECYTTPLPVVIDDCTTKVTPLLDQLKSLSSADCTADKVKPIVDEIKGVVSAGVEQLTYLGKGNVAVEFVLSTGEGSLSVADAAKSLAGLVNLILGTIAVVLKLVVSAQFTAVIAIFADLTVTVAQFVSVSCSLVTVDGGLLAAIVPSIQSSLGVVITLGVSSHFGFLGVDFVQLASELGVAIGLGIGSDVAAEATVSLVSIVTAANVTLVPLVQQLQGLSVNDCNSTNVLAIVLQIKAVLIGLIAQIRVLVGQSIDVVLASDSGSVISVSDAANLIGALVISIFDAICIVIRTVSQNEAKAVVSILVDLGLTVGEFIKVSISVVTFDGGLLVPLLPIIKEYLGVCITLGITSSFDFIGVDWVQIGVVGVVGGGVIGGGAGLATTVSSVIAITSTFATGGGSLPTGNPGNGVQPTSSILTSVINGGSTTFSAPVAVPTSGDSEDDCEDDEEEGQTGTGNGSGNGNGGNGDEEEDCDEEGSSAPGGGATTVPPASASVHTSGSVPTGVASSSVSVQASGSVSTGVASSSVPNSIPTLAPSTGASTSASVGPSTVVPTSAAPSSAVSSGTPVSSSLPQCSAGAGTSSVVSAVTIVADVSAKISVLVESLKNLSASDCNTDKIQPIVDEIKAIFVAATVQIKVLVGASVTTILDTGCGQVISTSEFAAAFGAVINLVFGAISVVLKTAGSAQASVIISIFVELGVAIGEFVQIVCTVVDGGIIGLLIPIIKVSLGVCIQLGVTSSFEFLQCDFTQIAIDLGITVGAGVGVAVVSLVDVVANITTTVTPLVEKLKGLSAADCTADIVGPIVIEIKAALNVAIEQITLLVGASVDVVLASGGSVISIDECGKLIGALIVLILDGCGAVLKVVLSANSSAVISVFAELGVVIAAFIKICVSLSVFNGGLVAILVPIIKTSLGLCVTLGITGSFDFLGIDFTSIGVGATVSIVTILNNATSHCQPLIDKLQGLTADQCTADVIGPIVVDLKAILTLTIQQIQVLAGASLEVVLASGSGAVISVQECATLVGGLVTLVLNACTAVLKIVVSVNSSAVIGVFADLGACVGELVKVSCNVVTFDGGLVGVLTPIIKTSLGVCITLGVSASFDILGIDFTQLGLDLGIAVGGGAAAVVSLPVIIANVTSQITPIVNQLKGLKASECGGDQVGALIGQIKVIIGVATEQIKALAGVAVNVALAGSDGAVLEVNAAATLVADLVNLLFGCLEAVLSIVGVAQAKVVFGLCADLGVSIGLLLQACTSVIVGLQASLIPLITTSLGVCIQLAITTSFDFLGVDFNGLSSQFGINITGSLNAVLSGGFRLITGSL